MNFTIFTLYWADDVDEAEVVSQLAELNAIPGCRVVPMVPADMNEQDAE